ncbi:hypothetical protein COV93_02570 [Candidatus Woesearchaeota archaeon CG11_big_fil_rev_8_21_14_0_20_43_8]|nr:MAG: hypothetical protein COV93_02570 [Candidatus Woesearchaeota archaeon CG11_big_fil_rev_8_21_14_0_20_43_8]
MTKSRDFAVINGLIGGLATFGTHHLGAVCENMKLLDDLGDNGVKMWVDEKLSHGMKLCGFGHPVYKKDRRPDILYASIEEVYPDHKMLIRYNALRDELHSRKGIHPNIDAVVGLAYSCMNFEPEQGIYLSFLARSLSMMSHILEEFPGKPFDFFLKKSKRER